jgi:hypothetical protein
MLTLYPFVNYTSDFGSRDTAFIAATFPVPYISEVTKPGLVNFLYYKYINSRN